MYIRFSKTVCLFVIVQSLLSFIYYYYYYVFSVNLKCYKYFPFGIKLPMGFKAFYGRHFKIHKYRWTVLNPVSSKATSKQSGEHWLSVAAATRHQGTDKSVRPKKRVQYFWRENKPGIKGSNIVCSTSLIIIRNKNLGFHISICIGQEFVYDMFVLTSADRGHNRKYFGFWNYFYQNETMSWFCIRC